MIRILHVIGSMNSGGAEAFIMNLYHKIDRTKVQFDFVVHTTKKGFYDEDIHLLGGRIFQTKRFNIYNFCSYVSFWKKFYREHPEYKILHGHINSSAAIYVSIAKSFGIKTIVHSHATKNTEKSLRALAFRVVAFPIRYIADEFFACSKRAGLDRFGENVVHSEHFQVINNGIDPGIFCYQPEVRKRIRRDNDVGEQDLIIGHVGRFTYAKNHKFIIDVFRELKQIEPNSFLWLVGGGGGLENEIKQRVNSYGLEASVKFVGVTDQVSDYLQAFDVFIFPSLFEGLGVALIEAQATGLPCLVSENIQEEANICQDLFHRQSISKGAKVWSKALLAASHIERYDRSNHLHYSGFDINDIAKNMQDFYTQLSHNSSVQIEVKPCQNI